MKTKNYKQSLPCAQKNPVTQFSLKQCNEGKKKEYFFIVIFKYKDCEEIKNNIFIFAFLSANFKCKGYKSEMKTIK